MIFSKLSQEQADAVKYEGNLVLTACPGSGKTRVIIYKLAHELLKLEDNEKKKIAAVTFTVRASEEIFKRLELIGVKSNKVWSGTLHSFCLEWILRPYSAYIPSLVNGFSIADEPYCGGIISDLKSKLKINAWEDIVTRIRRDGTFVATKPEHIELLGSYHRILNESHLIDFDLLLYHSYQLLITFPKIAETLSNILKLICVDEFQDTQDLLYAIICTIVAAGKGKTRVMFVGDTDQAIYGSLGGIAKSIDNIRDELGGLPIKPLTLTGNYRSSQRIINFYSAFQSQKFEIKALGRYADEPSIVSFNRTILESQLVPEIARLVQLSLDKNIPEKEICVLVPQWWLITSITKKLRAALPHVKFDATNLTPMSKLRENIWHKLSRLFLSEPNPRIYSLRHKWAEDLINDFSLFTNNQSERFISERNLLKLVNSITSAKNEGVEYLDDCFDQFLKAIQIDFTQFPELVTSRKAYFDAVNKRISDPNFKVPSDIQSFKNFYKQMDGIVINTCVGIKGEEFETVIAFGLLNGFIPHREDISKKTDYEAQRKLLYVVCSRAKRNLHLISEVNRQSRGQFLQVTPELGKLTFDYDIV